MPIFTPPENYKGKSLTIGIYEEEQYSIALYQEDSNIGASVPSLSFSFTVSFVQSPLYLICVFINENCLEIHVETYEKALSIVDIAKSILEDYSRKISKEEIPTIERTILSKIEFG